MAITIDTLRAAKKLAREKDKPVKLSVGQGVRVNVSKTTATFQLRYRINIDGKLKEKILTLDKITSRTDPKLAKAISDALDAAEDAKKLVKQGVDPSLNKRIKKSKTTKSQRLTADEFFPDWIKGVSKAAQWSKKHLQDMTSKYNNIISPNIGNLPLESITRQEIANLLEDLSDKPATYKKVRGLINMLLEDATTLGKIKFNPTPRKTIKSVEKYVPRKLPAITNLPQLHNILAGINRIKIAPEVREAALLQAHTALRSQTIVAAKWSEFDLTNKLWRIPRIKGRIKLHNADKYGEYYTVPLSDELVSQLTNWYNSLRWKQSNLLFSSNSKSGHITIDTLQKVYKKRLKLDTHCAHGWRTSFSTIAHEAVDKDGRAIFRTDVIERCLDHVVGTEVTQAYNRGELLDLRASLMSWWSKQLCDSNVVEITKGKKVS